MIPLRFIAIVRRRPDMSEYINEFDAAPIIRQNQSIVVVEHSQRREFDIDE